MITQEEFLQRLRETYDPEELVSILGLDTRQIITLMPNLLWAMRYRFLDIFEEEELFDGPVEEPEEEVEDLIRAVEDFSLLSEEELLDFLDLTKEGYLNDN